MKNVRRSSSNDEGFTLIELLLAMVMTGIVAGVVALVMITALKSQRGVDDRLSASSALQTLTQWYTQDGETADHTIDPRTNTAGCPTTAEYSGGKRLFSFTSEQLQDSNGSDIGSPWVSEYRWIETTSGGTPRATLVRLRCHLNAGSSNDTTVVVISTDLAPEPGNNLAMDPPTQTDASVSFRIRGVFGRSGALEVDMIAVARKQSADPNAITGPCAVGAPLAPIGVVLVNPADPLVSDSVTTAVNGQLAQVVTVHVTTAGRCNRPLVTVESASGRPTRGSPMVMTGGPTVWDLVLDASDDVRWPANTNTANGGFSSNVYTMRISTTDADSSAAVDLGSQPITTQVVACRQVTPLSFTHTGMDTSIAVGPSGQIGETVTFSATSSVTCLTPNFTSRPAPNGATTALTTPTWQLSGGVRIWRSVVDATSAARWLPNADFLATATTGTNGSVNLGQVQFHTYSPTTCMVTAPLTVAHSNSPSTAFDVDGPGATAGRLRTSENLVVRVSTAASCTTPVVSFATQAGAAIAPSVNLTQTPAGSGIWTATLTTASAQRFIDGDDPFTATAITHDPALPTVDIAAGTATFTSNATSPCSATIRMSKTFATGTPNQFLQLRSDSPNTNQLRENVTFTVDTAGTCLTAGANLRFTRGSTNTDVALGSVPYSVTYAAGTIPSWLSSAPIPSTFTLSVVGLRDRFAPTVDVPAAPFVNPYTNANNFVTNGSTPCTTTLTKTAPTGFVPITSAGVIRQNVVFTLTNSGSCGAGTPQLSITNGVTQVTSPAAMSGGSGTWTRTFTAGTTPGWGNGGANLTATTTGLVDPLLGAVTQTLPYVTFTADPCTATLTMTKDQASGAANQYVNVRSDNSQLRETVSFALNTTGTCSTTAPRLVINRTNGTPATVTDVAMIGSGPFSSIFLGASNPGWGTGGGTFVPTITGLVDSVDSATVTVPPFANPYTAQPNFTTAGSCRVIVTQSPTGLVQVGTTGALRGAVTFTATTTGQCGAVPTLGVENSGGSIVTASAAMTDAGGGVFTRTFADASTPGWGSGAASFTAFINGFSDPMTPGPLSPQPTLGFTTALSTGCAGNLTMSKTLTAGALANNVQVRSDVGAVGQLREAVTFTLTTTGSCSSAPRLVIGPSNTAFAAGAVTFAAGTTPSWSGTTIPATLVPSVTNLTDTTTGTSVTVAFTNPYTPSTPNDFRTLGSAACVATLTKTNPVVAYVPVETDGSLRDDVIFTLTQTGPCSGSPTFSVTDSSSATVTPSAPMNVDTATTWIRDFGVGTLQSWGTGGGTFNGMAAGLTDTYTNQPVTVAPLSFVVQAPCSAALGLTKSITGTGLADVQVRNDGANIGILRENVTFALTMSGSCGTTASLTIGSNVTPMVGGAITFTAGTRPGWSSATTVPATYLPRVLNLRDAFDNRLTTVTFINQYTSATPNDFRTAGSTPCATTLTATPVLDVATNGATIQTASPITAQRSGGCSAANPQLSIVRVSNGLTVYGPTAMPTSGANWTQPFAAGTALNPIWGTPAQQVDVTVTSIDSVTGATQGQTVRVTLS